MNSTISFDAPPEKIEGEATCHLLPCKISFNGKCNSSNYFTPYIKQEDDYLKCSFRGYPLKGKTVKVPKGHMGLILKESKQMSQGDDTQQSKHFKLSAKFSKFTSWNWDKIPSSSPDDKIDQVFDWLELAADLHKPVSEYTEEDKALPIKTQVKRKNNED